MIFILIVVEIGLYYDAEHDFSLWLKTGYNPAGINRLPSHTGTIFTFFFGGVAFLVNLGVGDGVLGGD